MITAERKIPITMNRERSRIKSKSVIVYGKKCMKEAFSEQSRTKKDGL